MPRRALVTGGAGFIGSHVADILIANEYAVTVVDNLSSGKRSQIPSAADVQGARHLLARCGRARARGAAST